MHRLFTASAIIVSAVLIAQSADARPHYRSFDPPRSQAADHKHDKWVIIESARATIRWAPGVESRNVRVKGRISKNAKGEPQHGALKILKPIDKASPLLARAVKSRRPMARIILIVPATQGAAAGTSTPYFRVELKNTRVSNYHRSADDVPTESMSLNF